MFVVVAWVGYWGGGMLVDQVLAPMIPSLFAGLIGEIVQFVIPTSLVYFLYIKFGRG